MFLKRVLFQKTRQKTYLIKYNETRLISVQVKAHTYIQYNIINSNHTPLAHGSIFIKGNAPESITK